MKLISCTDFVLEQIGIYNTYESELELKTIRSYANFLKQPLKLEMFVPCDDEGNVLDKPSRPLSPATDIEWGKWSSEYDIYQQAKEKVLFEGCEIRKANSEYVILYKNSPVWGSFNENKIIELITVYGLTLTESALKQIGI